MTAATIIDMKGFYTSKHCDWYIVEVGPAITTATDGERLSSNSLHIFLAVIYDRQLTCAAHVRLLCQSMSCRINLLSAYWKHKLGMAHFVRSISPLCLARWNIQYWSGDSGNQLPPPAMLRVQLEEARAISTLTLSTPVEVVHPEAQLLSISMHFQTIFLL